MPNKKGFSPKLSAAKHFAFLARIPREERVSAHKRFLKRTKRKPRAREILQTFTALKNDRMRIEKKVQAVVDKARQKFPELKGVYFFGSLLTKAGQIHDIDIIPILNLPGKPGAIIASPELVGFLWPEIEKVSNIPTDGFQAFFSSPKGFQKSYLALNANNPTELKKALAHLRETMQKGTLRLNPNAIMADEATTLTLRKTMLELIAEQGIGGFKGQ